MRRANPPLAAPSTIDALKTIVPDVLRTIRHTLIEQETLYQQRSTTGEYNSIWAHSVRVACIARRIAELEGWAETPALLAGLLHDAGKFAHGSYHANDTPEEEHAVRIVNQILTGTDYEKWLPTINEAILVSYLDGDTTSDIGRALYDADCLDKLGCLGVAQFFIKNALRQRFMDQELLIRSSIELTYAHHAPSMLKTASGRSLARHRGVKTQRFYRELLDEWREFGIGRFEILKEEIAGIVCVLVVPDECHCGGPLMHETDIRDALKCRSAVVSYHCTGCGSASTFSFCLPTLPGIPRRLPAADGRQR
jgi:uncharacterized protein